ncbi:hypothetical protein ACSYDW_12290 [Paeniglutamicibacter sp. R2-26]|uniref:hypothetical protein n=1 Tax=Paeniglutamicibacter sp. R2-26 TaxID=3144417 RepID=UPI003EE81172
MTTSEKFAWTTGLIASGGLFLYSTLVAATTSSLHEWEPGRGIVAPMIWTTVAICVSMAVSSHIILRGRSQESDQRDAWSLGVAYRGRTTPGQGILLVGGILPALVLAFAAQYAFANALFTGLLLATVARSFIDLANYRRRRAAPRIARPSEVRGRSA